MTDLEQQASGGGMFLFETSAAERVFTPEDFTREHKDVLSAIEEFIKGEILSRGEEIETLNYPLSRELMRKCGELGFLGIDIPETYGGTELDKVSSAIVSERFGHGAGSFGLTELNSTGIGMLPVALFGTEEQKKKYLPGLSAGKLIGAFALTEPEAGSDALNSMTTATLSPDGKAYLLNGSKQFITNAGFADIVFTYGKVDGRHFTAFILEQPWAGISTDEEEEKMGYHGTSTRAYHFDNVRVPRENVLGEVGKGHLVALNALNMGRFKVGALCMGHAKRAFLEAVRYSKQRVQFGRPICEFGLIKEKIARMAVRLFAAESVTYRTAGLIQGRVEATGPGSAGTGSGTAEALREYLIECSINKVLGSETEGYVVDEEVQIFGGYGYIHGNHPELAYRHARPNRIWEGTNEINRIVILNTLLARVAKGPVPLRPALERASENFWKIRPVEADDPETLEAQARLLEVFKGVFLSLFRLAHEKYGEDLREEQALVGLLSNMIIGIYGLDTTLLRTRKLFRLNKPDRTALPLKMTKVLFHESGESVSFVARQLLEALDDGESLKRGLEHLRRVLSPPPMNSVALRKEIADAMIRYGGYFV
jgi:alkylation response protein AidB-like acyl-CoA dehydrogenase